ncbi:hypothetical protein [Haloarchaeobius sp. HME9146]|uniref:DUF7095 family protein n=1 Tax=Haloarchaeobius sp. HME9146 TaxID=2978732 RepID=UPI0021C1A2F3|nr:hypothetical protein [Haloarchaeobius sp. HME9146]MCT9095622.1 hypothetical protein [Haloarchaeobius sp. HME9146]
MSLERDAALDRVEAILDAVESGPLPVPVREVWVYGDVALGLDPVDRLDVYLTKDILLGGDASRADEFEAEYGVKGVGQTVRTEWADEYPEYLRANANGHAAPEKCLAAHLLEDDEPVHLEVCNASFEDNVTQRLAGAKRREDWTTLLDPRGVCLWAEGQRSEEAMRKLRESELALPTLSRALGMLGLEEEQAQEAAKELHAWRDQQEGATVRGDVV